MHHEAAAASLAATGTSLADRYREVRAASLKLAEPLAPEDCVVQTIPEVSPTKWHLAHVTWFFEQFCLKTFGDRYREFDADYHFLFNSYYYTVGRMHARDRRGLLNRPLLTEIIRFREYVDEAMLQLIESRAGDPQFESTVALGLHHEQQHQELLLTDIKHVLFSNPLSPSYLHSASSASITAGAAAGTLAANDDPAVRVGSAPPLHFIERPGGRFRIGAAGDSGSFFFDNETPRHDVLVAPHALANRLVSNSDFHEFIEDGGYRSPALWLADGWARVQSGELDRPWYWSDDLRQEFTLNGWQPLDPAAPVCHLSFYEADAYARWSNARLPLESEWELAADATSLDGNLLDTGRLHPAPTRALQQMWGDVWEWTSSPYLPYPGFRPLDGSLGEYNGKFMANQIVVRGGSCVTWRSHIRSTYRSFFYPQDRWQFLGLRLARDL